MKKRHSLDDDLKDIPSIRLSEDDSFDYRHTDEVRSTVKSQTDGSMGTTKLIWVALAVMALVMLAALYLLLDARSQLSSAQLQLGMTTGQIEQLKNNDKQVSSTGSTLQDQLKTLRADINKLQKEMTVLQLTAKNVEQQTQKMSESEKSIARLTSELDAQKNAIASFKQSKSADVGLSSQQLAKLEAQAAQLKALESKVNALSLDVSVKQEQNIGVAAAPATDMSGIQEQLKAIDAYRQSTNASLNQVRADINKLYLEIEALK